MSATTIPPNQHMSQGGGAMDQPQYAPPYGQTRQHTNQSQYAAPQFGQTRQHMNQPQYAAPQFGQTTMNPEWVQENYWGPRTSFCILTGFFPGFFLVFLPFVVHWTQELY
jgi:hypothetical protein